ncbi:hypothetical protein MJH12_01835 [bacterium]|nr:hypothetical protein [bacterium]
MKISFKNLSLLLLSISFFFLIGCNSPELESAQKKQFEQKQSQTQSTVTHNNIKASLKIPEKQDSAQVQITTLILKIKPNVVDIYDGSGQLIGSTNEKGVFEMQVPSGSKHNYFFKKKGYLKKSLQVHADSEIFISYVRLDALDPLLIEAQNGNHEAQLKVGDMYFDASNGFDHDVNTANYFYLLSAQSGNKEAKSRLCAVAHQQPRSLDLESNLKYCRESAQEKNPIALFYLGLMYTQNSVMTKDLTMAKKLLSESAGLGVEEAQAELDLIQ